MNGIEFMVRDMLGQGPQVNPPHIAVAGLQIPPPRRAGCQLNAEQIEFILDMQGAVPIREMQQLMNVSRGAISNIWTGRDARAAKTLKRMEAA